MRFLRREEGRVVSERLLPLTVSLVSAPKARSLLARSLATAMNIIFGGEARYVANVKLPSQVMQRLKDAGSIQLTFGESQDANTLTIDGDRFSFSSHAEASTNVFDLVEQPDDWTLRGVGTISERLQVKPSAVSDAAATLRQGYAQSQEHKEKRKTVSSETAPEKPSKTAKRTKVVTTTKSAAPAPNPPRPNPSRSIPTRPPAASTIAHHPPTTSASEKPPRREGGAAPRGRGSVPIEPGHARERVEDSALHEWVVHRLAIGPQLIDALQKQMRIAQVLELPFVRGHLRRPTDLTPTLAACPDVESILAQNLNHML